MTPPFELTPDQIRANKLLGSAARSILLYGGSRSGKTFLLTRATVIRALKAKKSTHAVLRFKFNHLKDSIIKDTLPSVMEKCFPNVDYDVNRTDWDCRFPNDSRILFGGLDDKDRTEKILGQEHSTIYLNEASQITYSARNKARTRLAQNSGLALKEYVDCNPPNQGHWLYSIYIRKVEPLSGVTIHNPDSYVSMLMNPDGNPHLSESYLEILESLPHKERRRFRLGEFLEMVEGALWTQDWIDRNRAHKRDLPNLVRIVVAIDPSGCSGEEDTRSDEIGIVVVGIDRRGIVYVLDDLSGWYSPEGWAKAALHALDKWGADTIIAEINYGGAMVEANIRSVRKNAPIKVITASRGKVQRAEPVANLYEQRRVKHVGIFPDLEEQLCLFSTSGYMGAYSPDRADACIWGVSELAIQSPMYGMLGVVGR